jgi:COMPASS component SWD3
VFAVKFDKENENLLISGGWDNNVKVWDLREPSPIRSIYGPYVCGDSLDIHDGYILAGSWRGDRQLQLWDFGTCEWIEDIPWNEGLASPKECQVYTS